MEKTWQSGWITAEAFAKLEPIPVLRKARQKAEPSAHREELKHHHMLVRKTFSVKKPAESAWIDLTADDYYKLYVNGEFVGQGPAQGYADAYPYNRYDLSGRLRPGENTVAVHVYYQGLINRAYQSGDYKECSRRYGWTAS
ncbi:alpha-L-rhamnosidase N-terminal domain-containing protein [Paenibacillus filicis]|uniref:Alpha-L-rhamnosidase N-terminal domain-containing protein n=1 Tax=Paenibacillus gyeongsangnamensis TaxID=3388067 RepID=A0ABT4QK40_9BACL|nr:alpha-L-rhamnosidase N-terminal domain-containing protein [Paenibacillus filicis]MCZ8517162.1 alpha-L-rhamnosidase N-terminal domain-containing protein [Paenibacillus filicis]